MKLCLVFALAALLGTTLRVAAQLPGQLDTNYFTAPGSDATPNYLLPLADGKLLATGFFTNYGGVGRASLVRLNNNGSVDLTFNVPKPISITDPVIFNGQVLAPGSTNAAGLTRVIQRPDGKILFAGPVTHLGTQKLTTPRIAMVNPDGSPVAFNAAVEKVSPGSLLNASGNSIYVGGNGTFDGGTRLALVRLNADGSRDTGFTPPTLATLGYLSANVTTLYPGPGDTLYAAVAAAIGFQGQYELLRLTSSGALDLSFADSGKANCGTALSLNFVPMTDGRMFILNNQYATVKYRGAALQSGVVRLNLNGAIDTSYTPPPGLSLITGGVVQPDNKVIVLNTPLGSAARLNENGSTDSGYVNPGKVPVVQSFFLPVNIALAPDGSTYVSATSYSATFQAIQGVYHIFGDPKSAPVIATQPLAQTNTLGARARLSVVAQGEAPLKYQWFRGTTAIPGATLPDLVIPSVGPADDADYHCEVTNARGSSPTATVHLTVLSPTPGSVFRETDVAVGPNGTVNELVLDAKEGLYAVGSFTTWNNTNRVGIARVLPGVSDLDPAFSVSALTGNSGNPYSDILPLANGQVFVTGQVEYTVGGQKFGGLRFNADGSIDSGFKPHSSTTAFTTGVTKARSTVGPDGKVVLWASYWNGENVGSSFIRINPDGTRDTTFALRGSSYALSGYAITALPDGRYLAAARPNATTQASGVLRLNANGTVDPTFTGAFDNKSLFTVAGDVNQILVQPDGKILIGGTFKYRYNTPSPDLYLGLLRVMPDGALDPSFNPVPQLSQSSEFKNGLVRRIALQGDGRILAVSYGQNNSSGNFPRSQLIRFWPNGTLDPEFQLATNVSKTGLPNLVALAVRPSDNAIFVGGTFNELSGFPRTNFARVNAGPMRPTPAAPTIASQSTRVVAAAGSNATCTVEPGGNGPFQFQWRRSTSTGSTNLVDIVGATNATLVIPGVKLQPQDSGLLQCAVVNPGGVAFTSYITLLVEPNPAVPGQIDTSLVAPVFQGILTGQYQITESNPDGMIYGSVGNTLVRLREDGTPDVGFVPPADLVPPGGGINVVKRQPDGKILIAGRLKDGALARLMPDGSYDPGFVRTNNYTGAFQDVPQEMGLQSDGKIILGGTFANFAGRAVTGLIRFLPDGRVDTSFPVTGIENVNPGTGALPGRIAAVRVLPDDRIYIGGGFSHVRGAVRYGVARLNADGSLDTSFVPPTNGSTSGGTSGGMLFYQLGPVAPGGGVYIFGQFRPNLSQPGDTVLRLQNDGSADPTFHVLTDFQVNSGVVQPDGKLIVTGQFGQVNGQSRGGFARLNPDGSLDTTFTQGSTFGVGVPMILLADGKLLAGNRRFFTGSGPAPVVPNVNFQPTTTGLTLSWPSGFKLQRTASLASPVWVDMPVTSPFSVPASTPGEFFRIVPVQ